MSIKKLLLIFVFICSIFSSTAWAIDDLSDIEERQIYKTNNKPSGNCLSSSGSETGIDTACMEINVQGSGFGMMGTIFDVL
ncbi:MAG: hypothetical protein MRY83_24665 [Flavobacteriales bacterium]|nr:hypothetical protein [Flavobacteriales bacterium]